MINGQHIALRAFERRHLEQTRVWVNDPELAWLLDRARPVSDMEHEEWFAGLHNRVDCVYFAIETIDPTSPKGPNSHIGNVWLWGIDSRHRKAELRIMIGDATKLGQGLGTEAINLSCAYAFERLNLHKVYSYVLATNPRASRSFQKAAFAIEGTLRADRWVGDHYSDVLLLGRLNE
jgi:diamine N-acetyltransferase